MIRIESAFINKSVLSYLHIIDANPCEWPNVYFRNYPIVQPLTYLLQAEYVCAQSIFLARSN